MPNKKMIIMLGDSLTAGQNWSQVFPELDIANLGINGDTWAGVWGRLTEAAKLAPAKVFLMIGINDLLQGATPEEIIAGHLKIWAEIGQCLPQTTLYVLSLLPYVEAALPGLVPNIDIIHLNRQLAEDAEKQGLTFIPLFDDLANEDQQLDLDYTTDGIHLTPAAYEIWSQKLKPYLN